MWEISDARDSWATDTGRDLLACRLRYDWLSVSVFGRKSLFTFGGTYGFGRMWYVAFGLLSVTAESEFPLSVDLYYRAVSRLFKRTLLFLRENILSTMHNPEIQDWFLAQITVHTIQYDTIDGLKRWLKQLHSLVWHYTLSPPKKNVTTFSTITLTIGVRLQ